MMEQAWLLTLLILILLETSFLEKTISLRFLSVQGSVCAPATLKPIISFVYNIGQIWNNIHNKFYGRF